MMTASADRMWRDALPLIGAVMLLFVPAISRGSSQTGQTNRPVLASTPNTDFETGNQLYEEGKYTEAATAYGRVLQSGRGSAAVYFNLGNAYFKSRQIGRAIAAYRQAEQLTPRDPDVRANLQFARNQVAGPTLTTGKFRRWITSLSLNEWAILTAACLWGLFLSLAFIQLKPVLRSSLRNYIIAATAGCALCGAGLGASVYGQRVEQTAFAAEPEVQVRQGPLEESKTAFVVHDGAEMQVLDRKDDWLQVSTDPRRIGWIRRDQVVVH